MRWLERRKRVGKMRLRLGEDLRFQWGRFQQPEMALGLWGPGLEKSRTNFSAQCAAEKKLRPHLMILLPPTAAWCLWASWFILFLESKPHSCASVLIPFHLPARSGIHFYDSKLLFWFLRIGLPKCGCRISWFIWVVWFAAISSINSSLGLGHQGRKVSEGICKRLFLKSQWQLDGASGAWREFHPPLRLQQVSRQEVLAIT